MALPNLWKCVKTQAPEREEEQELEHDLCCIYSWAYTTMKEQLAMPSAVIPTETQPARIIAS